LENDLDDSYVFGADAGAMIACKQNPAPAAAPFYADGNHTSEVKVKQSEKKLLFLLFWLYSRLP